MQETILQWKTDEKRWTSLSAQFTFYSFNIHNSTNNVWFVWTAFHESEKTALYGGETKTIESAKDECLKWLNQPIHAYVIEASFEISGQGTAVLFDGVGSGISTGNRLKVIIRRPEKQPINAEATMEFMLLSSKEHIERPAFLIYGVRKSEIVPYSQIEVYPKSIT